LGPDAGALVAGKLLAMRLRDVTADDHAALLSLNQASVRELSPLDGRRLRYILALAERSLLIEHDGEPLAFAIAIAPGADYDSRNYARVSELLHRFLYLDRIAVAEHARRQGLGAMLYDAMEDAARAFGRMACDVNVRPPNEPSLAFHAARGYRPLEHVEHDDKTVVLMCKELGRG
jgi:predicted GNAT superfamily acetyltransferase